MKRMLSVLLLLVLTSAGAPAGEAEPDWTRMDFAAVEQAARSTKVTFFMYGGWAHVNKWIDTFVARELKKRYDIELNRVPMDASIFVNKLLNEKTADKEVGTIDLLWINGENFKNAMEAGLLFGPFADRLPNFMAYVAPETVATDFGYPVRGYEAPYGRAQFVFEYDTARTGDPPASFAALLDWARAHPGRFTYPQPPDFTGSAFIRQAFYEVTGGHQQYMAGFDRKLFEANAPKLWAYLNELEPYLWQKGRSYPRDSAGLDTLFARGEVDLNMSYHPPHAQNKIIEGTYPATVRTYVMTNNSIFNTHFTAIPFNAPNKAGAMVAANFLLSVGAQLSKNDPKNWGDFTVLDLERLPPEAREQFKRLELGPTTLHIEQLAPHAVPEIPSAYLELLEQGWEEHVLAN